MIVENTLTEFEELALKKITKDFLIDCVYTKINIIAGEYGISNAEISKYIGWDPAGFNQKYNRSNDLRITTFIKIFVALQDLIQLKEEELGIEQQIQSNIQLHDLITQQELDAGSLFNHISAAAEGRDVFLKKPQHRKTYMRMKAFVLISKRNRRFNEREIAVYVNYYKIAADGSRDNRID